MARITPAPAAPSGGSQVASVPLIGVAPDGTYAYYGGRVRVLEDDTLLGEAEAGVTWVALPIETRITFGTIDNIDNVAGGIQGDEPCPAGDYLLYARAPQGDSNPHYPWPVTVIPFARAPARILVGFYGNSASGNGADAGLLVADAERTTLSAIPQTVAAGSGNGIFPYINLNGNDLSESALGVAFEVGVSNAAGTEKLIVSNSNLMSFADAVYPVMSDWDVREQIGTDLAVSANGHSIDSTAGGQFLVTVRFLISSP